MATQIDVNLQDAEAVCELFERAAEVNDATAGRGGSVVDLPDRGTALLTGDLHDNLLNFQRIGKLACLAAAPTNHIVLQETVHGESLVNGNDLSYRMLARIAMWKLNFPDQVHHVLSNHEMAQLTGEGIMKDGISAVEAFNHGLEFVFGDEADPVRDAMNRYLRSMPLAVRCANGVLCAHSLPSPCHREVFDADILNRRMTDADYRGPSGSAYVMVWGRGLAQTVADELGEKWNVKAFVLGHQHAELGWDHAGESMVIINSDHKHGVAIAVDLSRPYTRNELCEEILPLNGVL